MVGVQQTFRSRTPALCLMLVTRIWANISDQINEDALDPSFFIESRIIGGSVAAENRYPYSVALLANGRFGCGGSLISKDTVLTAAHCLRDSLTVALGRDNVDGGERIRAIKAMKHPRYNEDTDEYDIGLLFLENATTLDIPLPTLNDDNSFPSPGSTTYSMGWGDIDSGSNLEFPDELMIVDLQIISNEDCENAEEGGKGYRNWIFDDMLCTFTDGHDACQGDSGGPLIIRNSSPGSDIQVGVTSWGVGCALLPGVFSRVSMTYGWIQETVCSTSNNPPGSLCSGFMSPSKEPTTSPMTAEPTQSPTETASSIPSMTNLPTSSPSTSPTLSSWPTSQPSASPFISLNPSKVPSTLPTVPPTMQPYVGPSQYLSSSFSMTTSPSMPGHPTLRVESSRKGKDERDISGNSQLLADDDVLVEDEKASNSSYEMGHSFAIGAVLGCIISCVC